jgi:REP element-mobilizing transposase RayT
MPRKTIPLLTGETYHVFNRGVDKREVFIDTEDYLRFYSSLNYFNDVKPAISFFESARKVTIHRRLLVQINAYCLLPNHFHIILTQVSDDGISELMKRVTGGYTSYFNEKYTRSGSLFQGTYKRIHIPSNEKLLFLAAYVNCNHIVHGFNETIDTFKTSYGVYSGKKKSSFIYTDTILKQFKTGDAYMKDARALAEQIKNSRDMEKLEDIKPQSQSQSQSLTSKRE